MTVPVEYAPPLGPQAILVPGQARVTIYESDGVTPKLYESDGVTPRSFPLRGSWSDELCDDGGVRLSEHLLSDVLTEDPDLLESGIGRVSVDGQDVFGFECVPTSGTLISDDEDEGREAKATAPGLRHLLTYAPVFHEVAGFDATEDDVRLFGWMSKASSHWYDADDWPAAQSFGPQSGFDVPLENTWPDPAAEFITSNTDWYHEQKSLFRREFTLTGETHIRVYYTGDDFVQVYLDGSKIGDPLTRRADYNNTYYADAYLSAGTHTLAVSAENVNDTPLPTININWVAVSVWTLSGGVPASVLFRSDSSWQAHEVSGLRPGWSAGAIILKVLEEAQAAGVYGADLLVPDFTGLVDSAGVAWPRVQEKGFAIGTTSLADVVRELEELACDVRILPDGTLQAFVSQGQDRTGVVLARGVNLLSYAYSGREVRGTRALVRTQIGWSEVASPNESVYGRRYVAVTSGTTPSLEQGVRVADAALSVMSRPSYVYTAEIVAVEGAVPVVDFDVGDVITAPDRMLTPVPLRVLSLTGVPDEQIVRWTVELEEAL